MMYRKVVSGTFISRPNRFIAYVDIDGVENKVHVKNTGQCNPLLSEGKTSVNPHFSL
jgi:sugar fermentation stimulation protein A